MPLSLFQIDKNNPTPIYAQLAEEIRLRIHRGELTPGDDMPTVRALAVELGINANTVARVYRDLQREGLLRLERGLGTFVAEGARGQQVTAADYRQLETSAKRLVDLCRAAGLQTPEAVRLVETLWKKKEERDA